MSLLCPLPPGGPLGYAALAAFAALAVLCNTAFPLSFDPVLLSFAAARAPAPLLALCGSTCAAAAALIDLRLLGHFQRRLPARWIARVPAPPERGFCLFVFAFALLPLPFSIVRAALLRRRPHPAAYAMAVGLGRLPRYLATVLLFRSLPAPSWLGPALLGTTLVLAVLPRGRA